MPGCWPSGVQPRTGTGWVDSAKILTLYSVVKEILARLLMVSAPLKRIPLTGRTPLHRLGVTYSVVVYSVKVAAISPISSLGENGSCRMKAGWPWWRLKRAMLGQTG